MKSADNRLGAKWCRTCNKSDHTDAECWGLGTVAVSQYVPPKASLNMLPITLKSDPALLERLIAKLKAAPPLPDDSPVNDPPAFF